MTRKELESLRALNAIIEQDREQLCRLREALEHPGHQSLTGMPSGGGDGDRLGASVARMEELRGRIEGEILAFRAREAEIYAFCMGIGDLWIREIVVWRCVRRWSWRKIAAKARMGEDTVQNAYYRWCRKNMEK